MVVELGLYGIYHDDRRIERHFADLAELVAPRQIVFNVQTQNPEIEYIARVWRNAAGGPCVWRLRPVGQILGYAAAAGYEPASETADRHGIYRVVRLEDGAHEQRADLERRGRHRRHRVSPPAHPARQPQRDVELRDLPRRHRASLGLDADALYPGGTTRLPADWADLGWLSCFSGPPPGAVEAMREAVDAEALNQYSPDLDRAAARRGRARARPRPRRRPSR